MLRDLRNLVVLTLTGVNSRSAIRKVKAALARLYARTRLHTCCAMARNVGMYENSQRHRWCSDEQYSGLDVHHERCRRVDRKVTERFTRISREEERAAVGQAEARGRQRK